MEKLVLSLWNFLAICHCLVWCHKSGKNREIMTRERPIGGQQKRERTKEMQIRYGWSVQYMNNPKGCSASVHECLCVCVWVGAYVLNTQLPPCPGKNKREWNAVFIIHSQVVKREDKRMTGALNSCLSSGNSKMPPLQVKGLKKFLSFHKESIRELVWKGKEMYPQGQGRHRDEKNEQDC